MRKYFVLLLFILLIAEALPQNKSRDIKMRRNSPYTVMRSDPGYFTGNLELTMNVYGRIQVFDAPGLLNLWQLTPLVGTSPASVFDYWFDAGTEDSTRFIKDSSFAADYAIYGSFNNSYSNPPNPPNVLVKTTIYFWKTSTYSLLKYSVINRDSLPMNATAGLELVSQIDGINANDTVKYTDTTAIIDIYKVNHVGIKLLSGNLKSVHSINFFDGYENDSSYYKWMTHDTLDSQFNSSDSSGAVTITSHPFQNISPGDSITFYYGLSLGGSYNDIRKGLDSVNSRYNGSWTSIKQNEIIPPAGYKLFQNYPNPFNPSTTISFNLAGYSKVSLKVYNVLGQEVSSLLDEFKSPGNYSVRFDSRNLSSGIYFYELKAGNFSEVKKMMILK